MGRLAFLAGRARAKPEAEPLLGVLQLSRPNPLRWLDWEAVAVYGAVAAVVVLAGWLFWAQWLHHAAETLRGTLT